jgi:sec-independent protein translocase protein TatA
MQTMPDTLINTLAFGMPSMWELLVILLIGLLIFGRRLPEVGRNIGKSIVEFKKGVKGIEDDVDHASASKTQATLPDESLARGDSASVEEAMGKVMPDADNQGNG